MVNIQRLTLIWVNLNFLQALKREALAQYIAILLYNLGLKSIIIGISKLNSLKVLRAHCHQF